MSYSFIAAQRQQQAAQRAYDNMGPEHYPDPFLESEEGQKWLRETATEIVTTGAITCRISSFEVYEALKAEGSLELSFFLECAVLQDWNATDAGLRDYEFARSDLLAVAIEKTMELLTPHADSWAEEQRREREEWL